MKTLEYSGETEVQLQGAEKAAAILFAMGKDSALKLAEFFSGDELKQLNDAANRLKKLNYETIDNVVKEFGENYVKHGAFAEADDLSDILGDFKSSDTIMSDDDDGDVRFGSIKLPKVEEIKNFVEDEPAIIGAFLLGTLKDEMAAKILTQVESTKRNQIFKAYLDRKILNPKIEELAKFNLLNLIKQLNKGDGSEEKIAGAAGMINCFPEATSDELVGFIEGDNPDVAARIKKFIFKFSAITKLDKESRSKLFDEVESEEIVKALGGVDAELKESILEVLSQRNRRLVESELTRGNSSKEEIEVVQRKIAARALNLAKEGKIILPSAEPAK